MNGNDKRKKKFQLSISWWLVTHMLASLAWWIVIVLDHLTIIMWQWVFKVLKISVCHLHSLILSHIFLVLTLTHISCSHALFSFAFSYNTHMPFNITFLSHSQTIGIDYKLQRLKLKEIGKENHWRTQSIVTFHSFLLRFVCTVHITALKQTKPKQVSLSIYKN